MSKNYVLDVEMNTSLDGRSFVSQRISFTSSTPEFWVFLNMLQESTDVRKIDIAIVKDEIRYWQSREELGLHDDLYRKVR